MLNHSEIIVKCAGNTNSMIHDLGGVTFWGAQTYMYVNIVHLCACILVVIIYIHPIVKKNLYNRLVLRHNVCLLILGAILTLLGYCQLNNCPFGDLTTRLLWLTLQYFTNATVFWLNIICFDMTLMITQLSWIPAAGNRNDENRKLIIYSILVWIGASVPTLMAAIFEFIPQIPDDFLLKANFTEASNGPRPIVNQYFFLVPACTLFFNNLLFILTTYNIIQIQRSTQLAVKNQESLLRKKYFLFLRLYLFMGAPWFFGSVLACLNQLVVLKVCRTLQPVLWLVILASKCKIKQKLINKFGWKKQVKGSMTGSNETVNSRVTDDVVLTKY